MDKIIALIKSILGKSNTTLSPEDENALLKIALEDRNEAIQNPDEPAPPIVIPKDINEDTAKLIRGLEASFQKSADAAGKKHEAQIDAYIAKNDELLTKLGEQEQKRADGQKVLDDQAAKDKTDKIGEIIKDMIATEKIPAKNEELEKTYRTMFETDFDNTKAVVDAMPGKTETPPVDIEGTGGGDKGSKVKNTTIASVANKNIVDMVNATETKN